MSANFVDLDQHATTMPDGHHHTAGADPGGTAGTPLIFGRQKIFKNSFTLICNFTHNRLRKIFVSGSLIVSSTQFL